MWRRGVERPVRGWHLPVGVRPAADISQGSLSGDASCCRWPVPTRAVPGAGATTALLQVPDRSTDDAHVREPALRSIGDILLKSVAIRPTERSLLLVSGAFLTVQVVFTDYGEGNSGAAGFWFAVGCLLLWLVHRKRSRVARGVRSSPRAWCVMASA